MLLIGTSAVVYPAAHLPVLAKQHGAIIIEINLEQNWSSADLSICAKAGTAMPNILNAVKQAIGENRCA